MSQQRLLLCRPASGLTDTLCQINLCCDYGEAFGRLVIVETDFAKTVHYRRPFSDYFVSRDPNLVLDAGPFRDSFDKLDVAPPGVFGRVNSYDARFDHAIGGYVDARTMQSLKVDFERGYDAPLLVHHGIGRVGKPLNALAKMRLQGDVIDEIAARVRAIAAPYTAIHVRNTDYETDYAPKFERLKAMIDGPIFIATDDHGVVEASRSIFGAERVFSFARLPLERSRPLHIVTDENARERNLDAIVDLFMLALSQRLYTFRLRENRNGVPLSGYSELADILREEKTVLQRLFLRDEPKPNALKPDASPIGYRWGRGAW
jgi:hypothetical protein